MNLVRNFRKEKEKNEFRREFQESQKKYCEIKSKHRKGQTRNVDALTSGRGKFRTDNE
jgi:hypothetical protein